MNAEVEFNPHRKRIAEKTAKRIIAIWLSARDSENVRSVIESIASDICAYSDEQVKAERKKMFDRMVENCKEVRIEAEAEGYRRGVEEAANLFAGTKSVGYIQSGGPILIKYTEVVERIRGLLRGGKA